MTILDANILIYAYNSDVPQHPVAAQWLTELFESNEDVGLPWITIWAFLRIATNSRIWPNPLPAEQAFSLVAGWLAHPSVIVVQPGPKHLEILESTVCTHAATGALVSDAVLAAMAMENGAVLASTDQDFRRFPALRWLNPLEAA